MGCFDIFCVICGNSCHTPFMELMTDYPQLKKDTEWLLHCTFLTIDNHVIHGCQEVSCNTSFVDTESNEYTIDERKNYNYFFRERYGVFLHTDCWKYIYKTTGVEINYGDLAIRQVDPYSSKTLYKIKYDSIQEYWEQDFNFGKAIEDGKGYYFCSPLVNSKSASRIKKVISQLKIKKDPNRKSPSVSATFFLTGTIKLGVDNNFWVIKNGKWTPLVKSIEVAYNLAPPDRLSQAIKVCINKIRQVGEVTETPLLIKSISFHAKETKIVLLGCAETIKKIETRFDKELL